MKDGRVCTDEIWSGCLRNKQQEMFETIFVALCHSPEPNPLQRMLLSTSHVHPSSRMFLTIFPIHFTTSRYLPQINSPWLRQTWPRPS